METVFLIQSAPLGKRWRRFAENLILSLFNFNFVGRDSSYSRAGGGVTREKGARSMGEERKKGKIIIINKKLTGKINNYKEKRGKQNI